jgi:hypothetical protein
MSAKRNIINQRNRIIRMIAERHCEHLAYGCDRWRGQMAYWIRQVREATSA